MLIFHEGLPGSGKSYAAMVDHVFPALRKGRAVYAYIEGLNHEKIAEASEVPIDRVRELLHQIDREQVPEIHSHVENDALVVIDELQNFWPSGRQKVSLDITQFVTEHRRRGLDILCMGQALADCHNLWRRRIENRIVFSKLSALGSDKRYSWSMFKQTAPGDWKKTTSGTGAYDPRFFGTYASHTDGTENTEHYKDSRAVLWSSKLFKFGIPGFVVILGFALWFLINIFRTGDIGVSKKVKPVSVVETTYKVDPDGKRTAVSVSSSQQPKQAVHETVVHEPLDFTPAGHIAKLNRDHRVRLGAVIQSSKPRVYLEWRDGSNRVIETLEAADIAVLGWHVLLNSSGSMAMLTNGVDAMVVTPWPLSELNGKVPEVRNEQIRQGG